MNLEEAVALAERQQSNCALIAKPPLTWGAEAAYVELTPEYGVPQANLDAGYQYLLGAEDLLRLTSFLKGKRISRKAAAEFVIHYAMTDCEPAWIQDVPDR